MPDEMRPSRPVVNRPDMTSGHMPMESHNRRHGSKMPMVVLVLVVIVLVALGVIFRDKLFMKDSVSASKSGYQAVFLTNGQVYFGKMSQKESDYVKLADIFYLQVNQPVQGSQQDQQAAQAQTKLSLVKLGQELHGPVDEMYINRSQILFFEDMKADGQVVQAIMKYKKDPTGSTTTPADQTSTQQTAVPQSQVPQTQTPVVKTPAPAPVK